MFCPNCGTKNPETATTCTKCGFNIKGAAAPKFKGTMLMMNQPGAAKPAPAPGPATPPPGAPVGGAPSPAGPAPGAGPAPAGVARPAFKGTMVGVAPPGGFGAFGAPAAAPAAAAPAAVPGGAAPTAQGYAPPGAPAPAAAAPAAAAGFPPPGGGAYTPPAQPQGYGTPGPAGGHPGGVNPLGGTVAIDQMGAGFTAPPAGQHGSPYGAPPAGYGAPAAPAAAPAAQQQWGAPAGQAASPQAQPAGGSPGGYGPPPAGGGYGAPAQGSPGGYGAPAAGGGYGAPAGGGYGAPQAGGYGAPAAYQPGGAMVQQPGAPMQGYGGGAKGKIRNPILVTLLIPVTCGIYGLIAMYSMMSELKAYLNKEEIVPWHIFVPILGLIVMLTKIPNWVTEAKQRAGSRNPQSAGPLLYFLLFPYFFTKDLNEVWDPTGNS